jgi:hypothetical protein
VLKNFSIYGPEGIILSFKEADITFLIMPIFKKNIVIPSLTLKSLQVSLERKRDGSFNVQDMLADLTGSPGKNGFNAYIHKVDISDGYLQFQDYSLNSVFKKDISNINLSLRMKLPNSIKFNLRSQILASPMINLKASGEFKIPDKEFKAKVSLQDLSLQEFSAYYQDYGINVSKGLVDSMIDLVFRGDSAILDIVANSRDLVISKNKVLLELNSELNAKLQYGLKDKKAIFSGKARIMNSRISAPEGPVKEINGINTDVSFDNKRVFLDIHNATANLDKSKPIEFIRGKVEFSPDQAGSQELNFQYLGLTYKLSGILENFAAPAAKFKLVSRDLSLESELNLEAGLIRLKRLSGKYLGLKFLVSGDLDLRKEAVLGADLSGELSLNLEDTQALLEKYKDQLAQAKLKGIINARFNLSGNINEAQAVALEAKFLSPQISAYGLRISDFSLNYIQSAGIAESSASLVSYDGLIKADASLNLNSNNYPFSLSADIQGVKIEKLKLDTAIKDKDISGTLQANIKASGYFTDLLGLSAQGQISISEGKLWQLDLFKGLGALLFSKDFANIIFSQAYCGFVVKDKSIFTDDLALKSNVVDLNGSARIGFDGSLESLLNLRVIDQAPLSGTLKDITTAVIGEAGRFGSIKISGTLKEPKYQFQPAVVDIFKGIKNIIFGE